MTPWIYISIFGLVAQLASFSAKVEARPQESHLEPANPRPRPSRFTARPGNVIVHFDRNHEIQRLQYVLQDGRLATLYHRPQIHVATGPTPIHVAANTHQVRRDQQTESAPPQLTKTPSGSAPPPPGVNQDQTIDILDSKMRGVAQLVGGDHVTIELPAEGAKAPNGDGRPPSPGTLNVLATVAADAMNSQWADDTLKKADVLLDKLKVKVSQKMHELPGIIESKLRAKSSKGHKFLDHQISKLSEKEEEEDDGSAPQVVPYPPGAPDKTSPSGSGPPMLPPMLPAPQMPPMLPPAPQRKQSQQAKQPAQQQQQPAPTVPPSQSQSQSQSGN